MELESAARPSAALPSISLLDLDKIKRDMTDHRTSAASSAMVSPSFPYSCPPPPYSHAPSSANSVSTAHSGLASPPESRRTSGDAPPPSLVSAPSVQSLPSISEALNAQDRMLRYRPPPPPPPSHMPGAALPAAAPSFSQSSPPTPSTSDLSRFAHTPSSRPPEPPKPYTSALPPSPMSSQPSGAGGAVQPSSSFTSQSNSKLPTLHPLNNPHSPTSTFRPNLSYPSQSSAPEPQPAPGAASQAYAPPYPSPYRYPPPPSASSPAMYHPPSQSSPHGFNGSQWRSDGYDAERRPMPGKISGPAPAYGEVVKRQLDIFDIEGSLNELADCSGKMLDFSRLYGQRAHQTARSGPVPGSIPSLADIDDLLAKTQKIHDALMRMKDVVVAQNAAFAEQQKDQPPPPANGYAAGPNGYQVDDSKQGGFAGADAKKRRGRAAPPGRCHSCNRAETPEWRRGPDGARTLCNACGLHYAKLTRKMGGNKTAVGSSNLRPKGPGSPTM